MNSLSIKGIIRWRNFKIASSIILLVTFLYLIASGFSSAALINSLKFFASGIAFLFFWIFCLRNDKD